MACSAVIVVVFVIIVQYLSCAQNIRKGVL